MMENELIELQTRLAFQEQAIEQMHQGLLRQQRELTRQQQQINLLQQQVKALMSAPPVETGNEPPPHY